jgi:hypothetical protein
MGLMSVSVHDLPTSEVWLSTFFLRSFLVGFDADPNGTSGTCFLFLRMSRSRSTYEPAPLPGSSTYNSDTGKVLNARSQEAVQEATLTLRPFFSQGKSRAESYYEVLGNSTQGAERICVHREWSQPYEKTPCKVSAPLNWSSDEKGAICFRLV